VSRLAQRERARFSAGREASKPTTIIIFFSKLIEPSANQQVKRVRIFRNVQGANICSKYSIIDKVMP
tara:strand:- start:401 stop:601 length:201 start_codon:yes stop_codon:yes gene_type:complete